MIAEDFGRDINEFENLLQKIATDITGGVIFERLPAAEIWNRSESSATSLHGLAERIMETMLLLRPERTPVIKTRFNAVLSPLKGFKETLFQKTGDPVDNARLALEQLRKSVMEGSEFVRLARHIEGQPSPAITEILKLREVYGAKDYLSAVLVPEAVGARFMVLKKRFEDLRSQMSNLEKALEEMRTQMRIVEEEIRKFRPSSPKTEGEAEKEEGQGEQRPASEPQLVKKSQDS